VLQLLSHNIPYFCTLVVYDKTGIVRLTWHWDAFVQIFLLWKIIKYYIFWVHVCSLHSSFAILYRHLSSSTFFPTLSHERQDITKLLSIKYVLIISKVFVYNISHFKKTWAKCRECSQDGPTGMMKLIAIFRNFPNAPKNCVRNIQPFFNDILLTHPDVSTWTC
jgi:hypothetical protein